MNYLASPPLVVAYALAGSMDIDITTEALGTDTDGNPVYLRDIWPTTAEIEQVVADSIGSDMYAQGYSDVFAGDERWQGLPTPLGDTFEWAADSTYVRKPPYFENMATEPSPVTDISNARVLAKLGDSVTTDHISPAGSIKGDSPAGKYLTEHGIDRKDFNSYGSRRGNHEVMIRGTFANIRLRNQLADGTEGGFTRDFTQADSPVTTIYDASVNYAEAGTPLVILAGKEYGSGSSRDWAAKGTALLGVRAVIAESYERIHRSNLIGMGVLPQSSTRPGSRPNRWGWKAPRPSRSAASRGPQRRRDPGDGERDRRRQDLRGQGAYRHPRRGRLLPARRDHAVRAAFAAVTRQPLFGQRPLR